MRLNDRLFVAGSLLLGELLVLLALVLLSHPSIDNPKASLEGLGLVVAVWGAFVVPALALSLARHLVPDQRSNLPVYLVMFVNLVAFRYHAATEDPGWIIPIATCIAVFVAAFAGTYWSLSSGHVKARRFVRIAGALLALILSVTLLWFGYFIFGPVIDEYLGIGTSRDVRAVLAAPAEGGTIEWRLRQQLTQLKCVGHYGWYGMS